MYFIVRGSTMKNRLIISVVLLMIGLFFISTTTYNPQNTGKVLLEGYITGFEICPHNPNTLYASSLGSQLSEVAAKQSAAQKGVFKSTDSGVSWKNIGSKDLSTIHVLAISEKDANVVFASPGG